MKNQTSLFLACVALFALAVFFVGHAQGQSYIPIPEENPQLSAEQLLRSTIVSSQKGITTKLFSIGSDTEASVRLVSADIAPSSTDPTPSRFPECAQVPAIANVDTISFNHSEMTLESAIKASLPVLNVEGGFNNKVFIRDMIISGTCMATDNVSQIQYGYGVRMLITVTNVDAKGSLSLPVIAANATLKNQSNKVNIVSVGITNATLTGILATLVGQELNVGSYTKFLDATQKVMELIGKPGTTIAVRRIGVIPTIQPSEFKEGVVAGYALTQIKDGKTCMEARSSFKLNTLPIATVIDNTYIAIMGICDGSKPSERNKLDAKDQLLDLRVTK